MQQNLEKAYLLQNNIINMNDIDDINDMYNLYHEIDLLYNEITQITEQIKIIRYNSKSHIMKRILQFKKEINLLLKPDLDETELKELKELESKDIEFEVAPGIKLAAIKVVDECHIPNIPLYYLSNEKEFAFKISGVVIRGHIGNIQDHNKKYIKCQIEHPKDFDYVKRCPKWHPQMGEHIGWNPSCFKTILDEPIKNNNKYMRHIGNKDTLEQDILYKISNDEINMRKYQVMHDLLIQLCINKLKFNEIV